jgi:hypothetical protein
VILPTPQPVTRMIGVSHQHPASLFLYGGKKKVTLLKEKF